MDLLYSVANNRPMQMTLDLNVSGALIKCDCAIVCFGNKSYREVINLMGIMAIRPPDWAKNCWKENTKWVLRLLGRHYQSELIQTLQQAPQLKLFEEKRGSRGQKTTD